MNSKEMIIVGTLFLAPALFFAFGVYILQTNPNFTAGGSRELSFGSFRIRFTSQDLYRALFFLLFYFWIDLVLPFGATILVASIAIFFIFSTKTPNSSSSDETRELIRRLESIGIEISSAQQHIGSLSDSIQRKQSEVDDREHAKRDLDELIRKKSEEAKGWSEQTEAQRQAFLETAVSAMQHRSKGKIWSGIAVAFLINILATITWTLLGNPGRDALLKKFHDATSVIF